MWHLMPDGRYAVTVTVDGRKDTTKLVSVAREGPETIRNFLKIHICFSPTQILPGNFYRPVYILLKDQNTQIT